jgi:hypothetical protein
MAIPNNSFEVPKDQLQDRGGILNQAWFWFFRAVHDRLNPLGSETSVQLENNISEAKAVEGLKVNQRGVSQATVEFLVQRVTSVSELIETGSFILSYNPTSEDWNISLTNINQPDDSGVDFTVDATGQVLYTSSDLSGTPIISRIVYRMRTLSAKSALYSSVGAR